MALIWDVAVQIVAPLRRASADATLDRALRKACRRAGFKLPTDVRVTVKTGYMGDLFHPLAYAQAPAWHDEASGIVHPLLVDNARRMVAKMAIGRVHKRMMAGVDVDGIPPAWTKLVHPLALRLVMEDMPDRAHGPYDWERERRRDARISDFDSRSTGYGTEEFTRIMLMRSVDRTKVEMVFSFLPDGVDGVQRAQVAVTAVLPHAVAVAIVGRPLSDLIAFAPTGHPDVDAAVASLTVSRAEPQEISTVLTLEPVRWITWDMPPPKHAGWDDGAPYVA